MDRFTHLILTRFNVKLGFDDARITEPDWLAQRFDVFERFTLPSVRAQTVQRFRWLVFFDVGTPASFREHVAALAADRAFFPCYVDGFRGALRAVVARHLDPADTHLITSRLDADDGLARAYVEAVQGQFRGQTCAAVNLRDGFILGGGRLYEARRPSNAFISLIERREDFKTVYYLRHAELMHVAPVEEVAGPPMWLQVVHGTNVRNRVTDCLRVPVTRLPRYFETQYRPADSEHRVALLAERALNWTAMRLKGLLRPVRRAVRPAPTKPLDPLT